MSDASRVRGSQLAGLRLSRSGSLATTIMDSGFARSLANSSPAVEEHVRRIEAVLREIIQRGRFALAVDVRKAPPSHEEDGPEWVVDFSGPDSDLLLEAHAELLEALAYVSAKAARLGESLYSKIVFDCRDYRRTRAEELKLTAQLAAEKVIESGEPFALNPMHAADRRTVHLALKNQPLVHTESQGMGSSRRVVILPASP
ncbi:MAG: protein jag [Terriglobia bacterium]